MALKDTVNRALTRTTGYQLQKAARKAPAARPGAKRLRKRGERLIAQPAFILSSVRSGSTLLRVLLNSHSQIHSPHELHLRHIEVDLTAKFAQKSLQEIGLDQEKLQFLLWDRLLHRELAASGKSLLVNKTPNDVFIADRIKQCWPDARFIFLLRHPLATARSRAAARPQDSEERNLEMILRYANALEDARSKHDGITVTYEDLTRDAAGVTQRICTYLGVEWEPSMLEYGEHDHGKFKSGLGDWSDKIKSGRIQEPEPLPAPEEVPPALRDVSAAWGYLERA